MHMQKAGCRFKDCPPEYDPHKIIYNRFVRWSERGVWQAIFAAVAAPPEPPGQVALDSSLVKIHRCASGGKGGAQTQAIGPTRYDKLARSCCSALCEVAPENGTSG
jgi:transposase